MIITMIIAMSINYMYHIAKVNAGPLPCPFAVPTSRDRPLFAR